MEMRKAALPPICRAALRALALVATFFIVGAAPALAAPAKVLVFTGTAGTPNASSGDIATAIQSLGTTGQYTADVTSSASDINATKLADYRAVVFVNSSGNVLDATQETALTDYVNNGGGFVGIGETALLEAGRRHILQHAARPGRHPHDGHGDLEHAGHRVPRPRAPVHPGAAADRDGHRHLVPVGHQPHGHGPDRRPRPHRRHRRPGRQVDHQRRDRRCARAPVRTPSSRRATAPPRGAATSSRAARSTPRWARRARRSPTPTSAST